MTDAEREKIWAQLPKKEKGKLNIYIHVSENSGVGYYRLYLPALKLRDHGLANVIISDFRWGKGEHVEPDLQHTVEFLQWADIVIVGRKDIPEFYAQWGAYRQFFNMPIVMDTDDNVRHVRPSNPGYAGYHPNSEAILVNQYATSKVFDAITVSTEELKRYHIKENPRIYVLPNSLDMKKWDSNPKKQFDDGKIRIGFIGSAAHTEGVNIIKKPMKKVMEEHPETLFLITSVYRYLFNDWPKELQDRIQEVPWIDLEKWQEGIAALGLDIGLAPLADNYFNRGKSNLRWLEYSAMKIPAVLSPVEPYLCVNDGVDGLLASERSDWYSAITKLVTDKELRYNIGAKAYERVNNEFNIDKNIGSWKDTYKQIHDIFHDFFGDKKKFFSRKDGLQEIRRPQ